MMSKSPPATADAGQPAAAAHQHRLHHELVEDCGRLRAERLAGADFAGALAHRHQHDVHHPDAGHHQRNDPQDRDHRGDGAGGGFDGGQQLRPVVHGELVMDAVETAVVGVQNRQYLPLGGLDLAQADRLAPQNRHHVEAGDAFQGRNRQEHPVVDRELLAHFEQRVLLGSEDADHLQLEPVFNRDQRPQGGRVREQVGGDAGAEHRHLALQAVVLGMQKAAPCQARG